MSSLRAELLGLPESLPAFRILLPAGWTADLVNAATLQRYLEAAGVVFRGAGRPDLDGEFSSTLERTMRQLEGAGATHIILPPAGTGEIVPLSMVVAVASGQDGVNLDGWVAQRFREGATLLDEAGQIVTWRKRKGTGEEGADQVQWSYLIPVPETARKKGLLLSATTIVESSVADDAPAIVAAEALFNAIASTVTWTLEEVGSLA